MFLTFIDFKNDDLMPKFEYSAFEMKSMVPSLMTKFWFIQRIQSYLNLFFKLPIIVNLYPF